MFILRGADVHLTWMNFGSCHNHQWLEVNEKRISSVTLDAVFMCVMLAEAESGSAPGGSICVAAPFKIGLL